jgi:hypothetical protein
MRRRWSTLLWLLASAAPAAAGLSDELLAAAAANARFPASTRADVRLERRDGDATTSVEVVLLGRGRVTYLETRDGLRALLHPGKIVVRAANGRVTRAAAGTRVAGSDLLLEDLLPVGPTLLRVPQVSDQGPTGTVVTGAPAFPSARALLVLTLDPTTHALLRAKAYEKSISDLAAYRKDEAFVDLGGHARPTRITIDRAREGTSTRLEVAWRAAPEVPAAAFTPAGLRAASPIAWASR